MSKTPKLTATTEGKTLTGTEYKLIVASGPMVERSKLSLHLVVEEKLYRLKNYHYCLYMDYLLKEGNICQTFFFSPQLDRGRNFVVYIFTISGENALYYNIFSIEDVKTFTAVDLWWFLEQDKKILLSGLYYRIFKKLDDSVPSENRRDLFWCKPYLCKEKKSKGYKVIYRKGSEWKSTSKNST